MVRPILALWLIPVSALALELTGGWELTTSTLTYRVTHPLHKVVGKSTAARGKGKCGAKGCEFLVAVPVKSFDSGDGNRDAHMWETVQAGLHPMIQVRLTGLKVGKGPRPSGVEVDAEVEFAGKKVQFPGLKLEVAEWDKEAVRLKGTLLLSLKAFGIKAPSLLTVPVEDKVPVELDLTWRKG
jgi:hypothetical protein